MSDLVGKKIAEIRPMTAKEIEREGWPRDTRGVSAIAIVLDDKTVLYPSRDPEGNGPGVLFGRKGRSQFLLGIKVTT